MRDKKIISTFKTVETMYNAHPFPNRIRTLQRRTDDRFRSIYEKFLHIPIDTLDNKLFLDAGCGTGENTWSWRRILPVTTKIMAVDLSKTSVGLAKSCATGKENDPRFIIGSLMDLGFADNSVDIIFCSGVLVAIPDPERAYQEITRVLKPGGYLILVLYHRYGRLIHGMKRAVIDLLERNDVERRVKLADRLFGHSMRMLAYKEQVPYEGVLYDQFGLPCESRYSVADALNWFTQSGIQYLGTWPPVEWSQLGKGLRFSYFFNRGKQTFIKRVLLRFFSDTDKSPDAPPKWFSRLTMETLWGFNQLQLFAISGRKISN